MPFKSKVLVLANRTADSDELLEALRARAARSPIRVTLLTPLTWEPDDPQASRDAASRRLVRAMRGLRQAGIQVEGIVGDSDPMMALADAWDPRRFDEVIVCTLPEPVSRWLQFDLPHRVERYTGCHVHHVVAEARHALAEA